MIKRLVLIVGLSTALLVGCVENSNTTLAKTQNNTRPPYLKVFQTYQQTALYKQCGEFEKSIKEKRHDRYSVRPVDTRDDMNIIGYTMTEEAHHFTVKCTVRATYQISAFGYIGEEYDRPLGKVVINR